MKKVLYLLIASIFCFTVSAKNIYVAEGSTGNGSAWSNAFASLQDALQASSKGDIIRVATGTYYPYNGNKRDVFFELKNGVVILGGYPKPGTYPPLPPGVEPPRDSSGKTNLTILSGDVQKDGIDTNNSYHVVRAYDLDSTTVLDGFTITKGFAGGNTINSGCGGGALVWGGNPVLRHLVLKNNLAGSGGGLAIIAGRGVYKHIAVTDNFASMGGGIALGEEGNFKFTVSIKFDSVHITNNASSFMGGGINGDHAPMEIRNTTIADNHTKSYGGGISVNGGKLILLNSYVTGNWCDTAAGWISRGGGIFDEGYGPVYQNVVFANNIARYGGGVWVWSQMGRYSGVTFSGNRASYQGDAFYCNACSGGKFQNSIFDSIPNGKQAYVIGSSSWTFAFFNCLFEGSMTGGIDSGGNVMGKNPMYTNPASGNYRLKAGSPAINAGNNLYVIPGTVGDLDNKGRIASWTVDMGAYEYGSLFPANVIPPKPPVLFTVYPNPANEYITIETLPNSTISLISVSGRTIAELKSTDQKTRLKTADVIPGLYYLMGKDADGGMGSQTVLIQH